MKVHELSDKSFLKNARNRFPPMEMLNVNNFTREALITTHVLMPVNIEIEER